MPGKSKNIVLDTWAVLAYLQDEPAGARVADLIADTQEAGANVFMTVVNAGEVWYILAREVSEADAESSIDVLRDIGIQFQDADWELTRIAARFKAHRRLSYADAYAGALAKQWQCDLVTGDSEFKTLEGEVKIRWLQ